MFLGVAPATCIQQVFKVCDFSAVSDVHVCCSGTFRFERAFTALQPQLRIHSNDVSLFSCAIGGLALGQPIPFSFKGELEAVEAGLAGADPIQRAAALMVAFELARYAKRSNAFTRHHFDHYFASFSGFVEKTVPKIKDLLGSMRIASFTPGDWFDHARAAVAKDALIVAFPPFTKGGYEAQFRFLAENTTWDEPRYPMWDPKDLRQRVRELEDMGARYCILTDQFWEDKEPVLKYSAGLRLPHYCYAQAPKTSLVRQTPRSAAFRYVPVDASKLTKDSKVQVIAAASAQMNFIKDVYLSKSITHVSGLQNWIVLIDGMLVGSIIYDEGPVTRMAYGPRTVNLLSDLSISREARLSKLIAMIALSHDLLRPLEKKLLKRYDRLVTTAFTKHPNSMKYRGVLKKTSSRRNDTDTGNVIQYMGDLTDDSPQEIFNKWWTKNEPRPAANRNPAPPPRATAAS